MVRGVGMRDIWKEDYRDVGDLLVGGLVVGERGQEGRR